MIDTLWIGTTWRRTVTLADEAEDPVVPDAIIGCLCPDTPITVEATITPGVYEVSLAPDVTADLDPGTTHWELVAQIGSDIILLTRQDIRVECVCAQLEVTP